MGEFVSIMGMAHAPGVTGWIESCPENDQRAIQTGYEELGRIMRAARPDVIIGVGNDHLLNLPLKNPPNWRVDCSAEWNGPAEFFKAWLKQPGYHVMGRPDVSEVLAREVMAAISRSIAARTCCSTTTGRCPSGISATTRRSCRST